MNARLLHSSGPTSGPTKRQPRSLGPEADALIQRCIESRLAAKQSQGAIAQAMGGARENITKIETKANCPLLPRFIRYARACGLAVRLVPLAEGQP
jgi:hypothetical protein